DMFRDILYFPVETPDNPFVAPFNIETIEAFMNRVGYQGVVDKKKEAIQYPRFIKLIIAYLIKKFLDIPQRIEEGYHFIKDDIPLEIRATDDFKEYETVFINSVGESSSPPKSLKITIRQQKVVEGNKDNDDSKNRLEPMSHKDNPEHVVDDADKDVEKVDEEKGGEMGSLETRTEKKQISIPTPPRSSRTILSSDKNITQELTETVSLPVTTTSNTSHSK
nr:hypothetical protein [Tanacetum cinerariifolium]